MTFTFGPCEPYATGEEVLECCCEIVDEAGLPDPVTALALAVEASEMLFILSARTLTGVCTATVRPCGEPQCWGGFNSWLSGGFGFGWWDPWSSWGAGVNFYGSGCSCCWIPTVELQFPVTEIVSVTIDGVLVPATEYQIMDDLYLARARVLATDPRKGWPYFQHLDLPPTEPGTFEIVYKYGTPIPAQAKRAAIELACELWKDCNNARCALPAGTTSVNRQGVSLSLDRRTDQVRDAGTDLVEVAKFISLFNPTNQRIPSMVWTPDTPPRRLHRLDPPVPPPPGP
jgi:hypothetical protein